MKKYEVVIMAILLIFSLVACGSTSDQPNTEENSQTESSTPDTEHTEPGNGVAAIILNMNGTDIRAKLYDNAAANAFLDLLPYTVTVSRATDDLCGSVSEQLTHDPAEEQDTWAIGEIGWFDGWFTILCDNEDGMPKRTRTIIGKVDEEDIPLMQSFTGSVKITITLDESLSCPILKGILWRVMEEQSKISPSGLLPARERHGSTAGEQVGQTHGAESKPLFWKQWRRRKICDIGILVSTDPVALDQACVDLIYAQKDGDGASL